MEKLNYIHSRIFNAEKRIKNQEKMELMVYIGKTLFDTYIST